MEQRLDIVERLRTIVDDYVAADEMSYHADMLAGGCQVAADEIERLRKALRAVMDEHDTFATNVLSADVRQQVDEALRHD